MSCFGYGVYFDPFGLKVDRNGDLVNPEELRIIQFEYDDDSDAVLTARRFNRNGEVIEDPWTELHHADDLCHVGFDDDVTVSDALARFYTWLEEHTAWVETRPGSYYSPAEYSCIGIDGYIDDGNPY